MEIKQVGLLYEISMDGIASTITLTEKSNVQQVMDAKHNDMACISYDV